MKSTIEDFGEKIGGARKDIRGNFTRIVLESLTALERVKLVRKDMVWPTPDYQKLVSESGYAVAAAARVKMLRDAFPSAPVVLAGTSDEKYAQACELYIDTLNAARRVCGAGKTVEDMVQAIDRDPDATKYLIHKDPATGSLTFGTELSNWRSSSESTMAFSWRKFHDMRTTLHCFASGKLNRSTARMLIKNPTWPEGTSLVQSWICRTGLNVRPNQGGFSVAVGERMFGHTEFTMFGMQESFRPLMGAVYPTQSAAQGALHDAVAGHYKAKRELAKKSTAEIMNLAKGTGEGLNTYRIGGDWRTGVPVVTKDYLTTFKLRGGEFGHWVSQSERQQVLDRGYDALRDLAEVCGMAPDHVSLGGKLAIAFGARGRGGKSPAAAHYEPGRTVINLTKPHGEGCLAHEWAHALDHHLGNRALELGIAKFSSPEMRYLSGAKLVSPAGVHPSKEIEFLYSWHETMGALRENPNPQKEHVLKIQAFSERWERLKETFPRVEPKTSVDVFASYDPVISTAIQRAAEKNHSGPLIDMDSYGRFNWPPIRSSHAEHCALELVRDLQVAQYQFTRSRGPSDNLKCCRALDEDLGKAYFARPHEMFARAFEAFISDTLKKQNRLNPYLVSATDGEAYPKNDDRALFSTKAATLIPQMHAHFASLHLTQSNERTISKAIELTRTPSELVHASASHSNNMKVSL